MRFVSLPLTNASMIAVNRTGLLTPHQQTILNQATPWPIWVTLLWLAMLSLVVVPLISTPSQETATSALIITAFGGTATVGVSVRQWRQALVRRRDIAAGVVTSTLGEVVPGKRGYIPQTTAGPLQIVAKIDLLPGPYRFYYLPQSRLLISAEKWQVGRDVPDKLVGHAAVAAALARVFNFTPEDLALNRAGKLSPRQKQRLVRDGVFYAAGGLIILALLAFMLTRGDVSLGSIIIFSLILGGMGVYLLWQAKAHGQDAHHGIVSRMEGKVTLRVSAGPRRSTIVYYVVRGVEFTVPVQAYYALVEGLNYRLHYTPQAKKVLSLEPLGKQ